MHALGAGAATPVHSWGKGQARAGSRAQALMHRERDELGGAAAACVCARRPRTPAPPMAPCSRDAWAALCVCSLHPRLAHRVHEFAAMPNDGSLGAVRKQGYLTKKPLHGHLLSNSRRRFFLLYDNALEWRASEHSPPKGRLPLAGASIVRRDVELIITSADEQLVLHGDDLEDWEGRVRAAVLDLRGSGWSPRRAFNTPHTFAPEIECVIRTPHTQTRTPTLSLALALVPCAPQGRHPRRRRSIDSWTPPRRTTGQWFSLSLRASHL